MVICRGILQAKYLVRIRHPKRSFGEHSSSRLLCSTTSRIPEINFHGPLANDKSRGFGMNRSKTSRIMSTRGMMSHPEIIVSPSGQLLVDNKLQMDVQGLGAGQGVTVHAAMEEDGKRFESCGCYSADASGVVDISTQPSLSGTYTGVSPMGLFWSMIPAPGQAEGIRLMKKNIDTPYRTKVSVYDGHLSLEDIRLTTPTAITSSVIDRWYKGPGVTSVEVKEGRVRGKLYLPPGDGPFRGVIDMFGSVGGITEYRAALLASNGFATLALPFFLYDDLPTSLFELDLEYFLEAVDWLLSHKQVFPGGVGVIGVSKGGDIALHMAAYHPKVLAVVNINGCTFNASAPLKYSGVPGGEIPEVEMQLGRVEVHDNCWYTNNCFDYTEEDLTPVWNYDAKILNIVGEDDKCGPSECIPFMKQHIPTHKRDNFIIASYPDAGHLLEPPYTPLCAMSFHKSFSIFMAWGGQPVPHQRAQEDSWRRILEHFRTNISASSVTSKL